MKQDFLLIDGLTKEFLREVYYRTERHQPDNSVEYRESIEMTACELAEQVVTGHAESDEDAIRIPIDESIHDILEEIYDTYEGNDGYLFHSYELSEALEQFLYSLGKYLVHGCFNESFSVER